jgi:hypothetical protein
MTPAELYHRLRRLRTGRPDASLCPLSNCTTCRPEPASLDAEAEQQRALDLAYTIAWMIERYPEVWYFSDGDKLRLFARGVLSLKLDVLAGRMTP